MHDVQSTAKNLFGKSHQVSRLWLLPFWCSKALNWFYVENTPVPRANRVKSPRYGFVVVMMTIIDLSQEVLAIDMLAALKSTLKHRRKHVLRWLRLFGD